MENNQRQEAEKRVIELGREIATIVQQIIDKETTEPHLFIKCGEMATAVKKLNAIPTETRNIGLLPSYDGKTATACGINSPSEPQPTTGDQQAEEFEGWRVFKRKWSSLACVDDGEREWARYLDRPDDRWEMQSTRVADRTYARDYIEIDGPDRLSFLITHMPEILNAAKGGKS